MYRMTKVSLQEARRDFFRLLERAVAGEEVIIARRGKPLARLVPCSMAGPETTDYEAADESDRLGRAGAALAGEVLDDEDFSDWDEPKRA